MGHGRKKNYLPSPRGGIWPFPIRLQHSSSIRGPEREQRGRPCRVGWPSHSRQSTAPSVNQEPTPTAAAYRRPRLQGGPALGSPPCFGARTGARHLSGPPPSVPAMVRRGRRCFAYVTASSPSPRSGGRVEAHARDRLTKTGPRRLGSSGRQERRPGALPALFPTRPLAGASRQERGGPEQSLRRAKVPASEETEGALVWPNEARAFVRDAARKP